MAQRFAIAATISRWLDDHQPGFVECQFEDRYGREWTVHEKEPVINGGPRLDSSSGYPRPCAIRCEVIRRGTDGAGREIIDVDTGRPYGIESVEGETRFSLFADQVIESSEN